MKADRKKLMLTMARAKMDTKDVAKAANMPRPTVNNVLTGRSVRPSTIGRIAAALGADVTDIMEG